MIFDDNKHKAGKFSEILCNPPEWTDNYYGKGRKQERMDQIIDTPFAVKSHHVGLVQVADLFAFIMRRYVEIEDFGAKEQWSGEKSLLDRYVSMLSHRLLPRSYRWPARSDSDAMKWYNSLAPNSLTELG